MSDSPSAPGARRRAHILVSGMVQGVGYRFSTVRQARRLNLTGWVRNTADGKVEILADGSAEDIRQLLVWCQHGPSEAEVTEVRHTEEPSDGPLAAFDVEY